MASQDFALDARSDATGGLMGQSNCVIYAADQVDTTRRFYQEDVFCLTITPTWTFWDYTILCAEWLDQVYFVENALDGDSSVVYECQRRARDTATGAFARRGSHLAKVVLG